MRLRRNHLAVLGVVGLLLTACGDDETTSPAVESASTELSSPDVTEPTVPAGDVIDSFDEVQPAVIQIEAQGSFRDPEVGMVTNAGRGSGFIISEDGLAVTNNHVVTGAATLEIFIGGDSSRSYNATVVGVSECNDLALIQIDADDPLPHLEWIDERADRRHGGLHSGLPARRPRVHDDQRDRRQGEARSVTHRGRRSTRRSSTTPTSSRATRADRSSTPTAGSSASTTPPSARTNQSQFCAIDADLAEGGRRRSSTNGDFESLGINGTAVVDEEAGLAGVWVAGTSPGSPASDAGMLPGDIVTRSTVYRSGPTAR